MSASTQPVSGTNPRLGITTLDLAGVAALAVIALFLTGGGAVMYGAVGHLDPWIYTGYIHDYGGTLGRFGRTYYSTRVAAMWPQGWAYGLFGEQAYLIVRWCVLMACGGGVALTLRRFGGRWVAYAGGVAMMCSALLLLQFTDDYTQEVGIAYALLAIPLIIGNSWVATAAGGMLVSLALNAHEGLVYLLIPTVIAIAVAFALSDGGRALVRRVIPFIGGVLVVQLALSAAMGLQYGWVRSNWFFQETAINMTRSLSDGGARAWATPWDNPWIMVTTTVLVIGAWAVLALAIAISRHVPGRRPLTAVAVGLGVAIAMILYSHFITGSGFVAVSYYIVYATTVATIATWVALATLSRGRLARLLAIGSGGAAFLCALVGPVIWSSSTTPWIVIWWVGIALSAGGLVVAAFLRFPGVGRRALAVSAAAAAGIILPVGPLTTSGAARDVFLHLSKSSKTAAGNEPAAVAVYSLAVQFQSYVNESLPPDVPFLVYYNGVGRNADLNSIQSVFLWRYSCIQCANGGPAFPKFDKAAADQLRAARPGALVVISRHRTDVAAALKNAERVYPGLVHQLPIKRLSASTSVLWVGIGMTG